MALCAVMAVLGWALWSMGQVLDAVARIDNERLPKLAATQRLRSEDLEASIALRNALLLPDDAAVQLELARFRSAEASAAKALATLVARPYTPAAQQLLDNLVAERRVLMAARADALRALEAPGPTQGSAVLTVTLQQRLDDYLARVDALYEQQSSRLGEGMADTLSGMARARAILALGALVATAGLVLLLMARLRLARDALAAERRQVAQLVGQRDALVREVHHRIKNHLQGLLSIIEAESATNDMPQDALTSMRRQVQTLVGVHGLQSVQGGERVDLLTLFKQQWPLFRGGHPGAEIVWLSEAQGVMVPSEHAVPLALVFSELLSNAIKHGTGPVRIAMSRSSDRVLVSVANATVAPALKMPRQGQGLDLARALLHDIAHLDVGPDGTGGWVAALTLTHEQSARGDPWPAS